MAEHFGLNSEWLEKNVHHSIPTKLTYMTRDNLIDTITGVKKYHPGSPYLSALEEQLKEKAEEVPEYVDYLPN